MEPGTQSVYDYLTQGNFFIAAGAIYLFPQILKRAPLLKKVMANQWVVRVLPLWPLLAAIGVVLAPGAVELPDKQVGTLMIASVWIAWLASTAHKVIGQTLLGDDPRIKTLAVVSPGQKEPVLKE